MILPKPAGNVWHVWRNLSGIAKGSMWPAVLGAGLVTLTFLLTVNNYLDNASRTITSDGVGYYDHLPSVFLHQDLWRKDLSRYDDASTYARIDTLGVYVPYGDRLVNKYPVGVALLQVPFFMGTWFGASATDVAIDGYERAFHRSVFIGTLFYLFLGLIAFGALLREYDFPWRLIVFCQFLLVLATPITHYANDQASYSHVYSVFAIVLFLLCFKKLSNKGSHTYFVLTGMSFGLVLLLRPVNLLVLLFLPFVLGSWVRTKELAMLLANKWRWTLLATLLVAVFFSIQCLVWYAQTGNFLLYSYQGEGFDLLHPHFLEILFGYRKGLFVYTPVLVFALVGLVALGRAGEWHLALSWSIAFIVLTYVLSSWWSWYYGASYGLRAYVDYLPVLFIPIAMLLHRSSSGLKVITMAAMVAAIPVNIIQTYQYKHYILHWSDMDREGYWKVFLKTRDRYRGLLWKQRAEIDAMNVVWKVDLGTLDLKKHEPFSSLTIIEDTALYGAISVIRIKFMNDFDESNDAEIELFVQDASSGKILFRHAAPLIQFMEKGFSVKQEGFYDFVLENAPSVGPLKIVVNVDPMGTPQRLENLALQVMAER